MNCLPEGEAALYSKFVVSGEMETDFGQFFFYSKSDIHKLPAVMFIAKYVEVRIANKPNHVILAVQAGNGAFYFGLIFGSFHQARVFIHCLETDEFLHRFTGNNITEEIISKLFEGY